MKLIQQQKISDHLEFMIYEINQCSDYFMNLDIWSLSELEYIKKLYPKRQLEYLASRFMLKQRFIINDEWPLVKNQFGKLYLTNHPIEFSLSHSHRYTGYAFGNHEVGFDLQIYQNKVLRILQKFLNEAELEILNQIQDSENFLKNATLLWSAKEAIYKSFGKKGLAFKHQILLNCYYENKSITISSAQLILSDKSLKYKLLYGLEASYVWAIATLDELYCSDIDRIAVL